jgi:hypothetical protein
MNDGGQDDQQRGKSRWWNPPDRSNRRALPPVQVAGLEKVRTESVLICAACSLLKLFPLARAA